MYLREMAPWSFSRAKAKLPSPRRIEAGRETMIAGLCESPLTFQALIIWRDELNEGQTLLREIIDLETTYSGPEAQGCTAVPEPERSKPTARLGREGKGTQTRAAANDDDITNVGGEGQPSEEEEETTTSRTLARRDGSGTAGPPGDGRRSTSSPKRTRSSASCRTSRWKRLAGPALCRTGAGAPLQELKDELIKAVKSLSLTRTASTLWSSSFYDISSALTPERGRLLAWPNPMASSVRRSWSSIPAPSSIELDEVDQQSRRQGLEGVCQGRKQTIATSARRSRTLPPRPAFPCRGSAASYPWSRRASVKRVSPRRRCRANFVW